MASIYQRPNSPFWWAKCRDGFGRQLARSTGIRVNPIRTADESAAEHSARRRVNRRRALEVAEEAEELARGNRVEQQVRSLLADASRLGATPLDFPTTSKWLWDWLEMHRSDLSPGTYARYKGTIQRFLESLQQRDRGDPQLADIRPEDLIRFRLMREEAGIAVGTIRADIGTLKSAFAKAFRQNKIPSDPAKDVAKPSPEKSVRKPFDEDQVERLLRAASDFGRDWITVVLLGACQGFRLGDCANLTWDCYDPQQRTLSLAPQKGRRKNPEAIPFPLHPKVEEHFLSLDAPDDPESPLTPSLAGVGTGGTKGLSAGFSRIMEAAGIAQHGVEGSGKGRKRNAYGFHSFRHSFASRLAAAGIPPELRMKLTAHLDEKVHARYTHHELDALRNALAKL